MTKTEILIFGTVNGVALVYLLWMFIHHAQALPTEADQNDEPASDRTSSTAVPRAGDPGYSGPTLPVGGPPETYKTHRLHITQCPDPNMWYAKLVGKDVPYLGTWPNEGYHKSREPAGFVNIVQIADAHIIVREYKVGSLTEGNHQ